MDKKNQYLLVVYTILFIFCLGLSFYGLQIKEHNSHILEEFIAYLEEVLLQDNNPSDIVLALNESLKDWDKVIIIFNLTFIILFMFFIFLIGKILNTNRRLDSLRRKKDFITNSLNEAILLINKEGTILESNKKAQIIWPGLSMKESENIKSLLPSMKVENPNLIIEDYHFDNSPLAALIKNPLSHESSFKISLWTQKLEPQWFWVHVNDFEKRYFLLSFEEITELKEAQELVKVQQISLLSHSRLSALGKISCGIAHELNNPLSIINSETEDLLELCQTSKNPYNQQFKLIGSNIKETTQKILKIVRGLDLFSFYGGESFKECHMGQILEETILLSAEKFKRDSVRFSFEKSSHGEEGDTIFANESQLIQLFINLLNNAYDAVSEQNDKVIQIKWEITRDYHVIDISDNGPGIPQDIVTRIFSPFSTISKEGKINGLGLSISKAIVETHKGSISVDTNKTGSKFHIKIPKLLRNVLHREMVNVDDIRNVI